MATDELFPLVQGVKRCGWCHKVKPLTEFHFRPERGRYRAECKECYREATNARIDPIDNRRRANEWRLANPEKWRERGRRQHEGRRGDVARWLRSNLRGTRATCKKRAIPCTILAEELIALYESTEGRCALTGRVLVYGSKGQQRDSISMDRIEPEKGYIPGNVRLVTQQANMARGMYPDEELYALCEVLLAKRAATPSAASP